MKKVVLPFRKKQGISAWMGFVRLANTQGFTLKNIDNKTESAKQVG